MADVAVQIGVLAYLASLLPGGSPQAEKLSTAVERIALSVLPIVAAAAELDPARMAWTHQCGSQRLARFRGVGVVA